MEFRQLLNKNFADIMTNRADRLWAIADYADALFLHPNHLSQSIKAEVGKTVKQLINEKIISETKALLTNTTQTISEIAFQFDFSDSSNFARFFKKSTGQSPSQFRSLKK